MSQLYARVFLQILDSSLADDWKTRHVFEDILKLVDRSGVCDMTKGAIARRTNVPLEIVQQAIEKLESPDLHSRDSESEGRRLLRLDDHRDWGWRVVNWLRYDAIRTSTEQREQNATKMARYRATKKATPSPTPPTQPQKQIQIHPQSVADTAPTCSLHVGYTEGNITPVQPATPPAPPLWPTLPEVLRVASMRAIPAECAEAWWLVHDARGGLDTRGQPIVRWEPSLTAYWASWRANETKDRLYRPNGRRGKPESKQIQEVIEMPILGQPRKTT